MHDVITKVVGRAIGEMRDEIMAECKSQFAFRGAWTENVPYKRGNIVTLGGVWVANNDNTNSRPAADNPDWAMMLVKPKDGRDGKDGRDAPAPRTATGGRSTPSTTQTRINGA